MRVIATGLLGAVLCATVPSALADEIDFYLFRTTHNESAGETAKFDMVVHRTNLINHAVDDQDEYSCKVEPSRPDVAGCKVNGALREMRPNVDSVRSLLTDSFRIQRRIVELKEASNGVFQAVLENDDVYHVTLRLPSVLDNSMECQVSVVQAKALATVMCRSEYFGETAKFMVRDVPVVNTDGKGFLLGAPAPERSYYHGEKWEEKKRKHDEEHAAAMAKVKEVVEGMARLKKAPLVESGATLYNLRLNVKEYADKGYHGSTFVQYNEGGYGAAEVRGGPVSQIEVRGTVQHIHRGAVRSGD